jgi:hypothetical protein
VSRSSAAALLAACAALGCATPLAAQEPYRQSREDAWWTGPILAAGAATLPKGHWLVEPYVFNIKSRGRYDDDGNRRSGASRHHYGSLTYVLYGLVDGFTVGMIPRFGYNDVSTGPDSSGIGLSDFTVQGTLRLSTFREGARVPTSSLVLEQVLPTGKYDRLGSRPSDGLGSGAYTTKLSLNSQYFLWMPNGRILRTRLNLTQTFSDTVSIEGVSVYGTGEGFRGHAKPGRSFIVDSAWEYSLTRNWVLALDVLYQHDTTTRLRGLEGVTSVSADSGSSEVLQLAPAVEYNWSPRMGVIVGTIFTAAGHNASAAVIPVAAVNMVF